MHTRIHPKDYLVYQVLIDSMARLVIPMIKGLLREALLGVMQLWLLRKLLHLDFAPIPLDP